MNKSSFRAIFSILLIVFISSNCFAQEISEKEVLDFLEKSQVYYKEKNMEQIVNLLTGDFTYEVVTTVNGETYDDKMKLVTYANYLNIFFESNADVEEYLDEIQNIEIANNKATVVLKNTSLITLDGESQRCSNNAVYGLVKRENRIQAESVRGTSQCTMFNKSKR